mmetsp:Transcript_4909/g.18467  ORF Transcript_4909/g.18467 Transcript_4909/m.18467 type:complete len:902 (-) Transcript_4909:40-2745(-)
MSPCSSIWCSSTHHEFPFPPQPWSPLQYISCTFSHSFHLQITHFMFMIVNSHFKIVAAVAAFVLLIYSLPPLNAIRLTIVHTNDLHSHFTGTSPHTGGYARISSVIEAVRQNSGNENVLTVDSGDWSVGTLFTAISASSIFAHKSIELDWFDTMRYDVTTMGNHEHDHAESLLRQMVTSHAYATYSAHRPSTQKLHKRNVDYELSSPTYLHSEQVSTSILVSNLHVASTEYCEMQNWYGNTSRLVQDLFVTRTYRDALTGESLRVGIIALHGPASASLSTYFRHCIQYAGQDSWREYVGFVRELARSIRKDVDLIVALAHGGAPEDSHLLDAVNTHGERLIDVHISSHTHEETFLLHSSGAIISQCREYGRQVGALMLDYDKNTKTLCVLNKDVPTPADITLHEIAHTPLIPHHIPITSSIEEHKEVKALIDSYSNLIDRYLLNQVHIHSSTIPTGLNAVVGNVSLSQFHSSIPEFVHFLNDVFFNSSNDLLNKESAAQRPLDFFLLPDSLVRVSDDMLSSSHVSLFTFGDCFRLVGTGSNNPVIDEYTLPGTDIVFFFLNKYDTLKLIEFLLYYSRFVDENFHPSMSSSVSFEERFFGIPFYNRLHNIKIGGVPFERIPDDHMIHIGTLSVVLQYLMVLHHYSWGLVRLSPQNIRTLNKKPYVLLSEYFTLNNLKIHAYTLEDQLATVVDDSSVLERVKQTRRNVKEEQGEMLMSIHRGMIPMPMTSFFEYTNCSQSDSPIVEKEVAVQTQDIATVCNISQVPVAHPLLNEQCFKTALGVVSLGQLAADLNSEASVSREMVNYFAPNHLFTWETCPAPTGVENLTSSAIATITGASETFKHSKTHLDQDRHTTPLLCWKQCAINNTTTLHTTITASRCNVSTPAIQFSTPAIRLTQNKMT